MQTIVLASSKGGSTKSTLSAELAVAAERADRGPVALVDLDPQRTTAKWCSRRVADTPVIAEASIKRLAADIDGIRQHGIQTLIINTPGYTAVAMYTVVQAADLIVVPVRATIDDLGAVADTLAPILARRAQFVFVLVGATVNARITDAAGRELAQYGIVAPVVIHHRLIVPACRASGQSVSEVESGSKAALEYADLWAWLSARMDANAPSKVAA